MWRPRAEIKIIFLNCEQRALNNSHLVFAEENFQWDACFSEYRSHIWPPQRQCSLRLQHQHPKNIWFCHSWTVSWLSHKTHLTRMWLEKIFGRTERGRKRQRCLEKFWEDFSTCVKTYLIWDGKYVCLCEKIESLIVFSYISSLSGL